MCQHKSTSDLPAGTSLHVYLLPFSIRYSQAGGLVRLRCVTTHAPNHNLCYPAHLKTREPPNGIRTSEAKGSISNTSPFPSPHVVIETFGWDSLSPTFLGHDVSLAHPESGESRRG
jgi:hypothetical protein